MTHGRENMKQKRILLVMYRRILADALSRQGKTDPFFDFKAEQNYSAAPLTAELYQPDIAVLEIPESGEWNAETCFSMGNEIQKAVPSCKLMILCPEKNQAVCKATIQAKRENRIDDFLYYDTTINYLFSKLEAL
jgi:hypothetical protein